MAKVVRVLVADDSPTMRYYLKTLINDSPPLQVVGEASNGIEAVEMAQRLAPDVISMDIRMPVADGLEATRRIMNDCPTPVVVVSGVVGDDVALSVQALSAGALAVVPKPPDRADKHFERRKQDLVNTLKAMAQVTVVARRDHLTSGDTRTSLKRVTEPLHVPRPTPEVVAIGASTGGPSALQALLGALPVEFSVPIVIVQHMPNEFIGGLVAWLGTKTPLAVRLAHHAMPLKAGTVTIAHGNAHLMIQRKAQGLITLLVEERDATARHRPSINVLFESVARVCGVRGVGLLLTGMGDDGAEGLALIKQAGGRTFAQDEASSTVYGMPASALQRGAVDKVVSLDNLPHELIKLL